MKRFFDKRVEKEYNCIYLFHSYAMKTTLIAVWAILLWILLWYMIFVWLGTETTDTTLDWSNNWFKQNYVVPSKPSSSAWFSTQSFQQKPLKID